VSQSTFRSEHVQIENEEIKAVFNTDVFVHCMYLHFLD